MEFETFVILVVVVIAVLVFSSIARNSRNAARMDQRLCRSCGAAHPPFAQYCRRCGQRL